MTKLKGPSHLTNEIEENSSVIGPDGKEYANKEACDTALYASIEAAFFMLFKGRKSISKKTFQAESQAAYQEMNLTEYAKAQNLADVLSLVEDFLLIRSEIPEISDNDTLFVGGCGDGRLLRAFIVLSKITGIKKIIFNDLNDYYLGVTKEKAKQLNSCQEIDENNIKVDGIEIEFLLGDIKDVKTKKEDNVIAVTTLYYVSSEWGDPSSPDAMTEDRVATGKNIGENILTHPNGVWIDETPDTDRSGLFKTVREMTRKVFETAGILIEPDENGNFPYKHFSITNWKFIDNQKEDPAQLRITPSNGCVGQEKVNAGFEYVDSDSRLVPKSSVHDEAFAIKMFENCPTVRDLERVAKNISALVSHVIDYPDTTNPYAKRTKKTIWRKST